MPPGVHCRQLPQTKPAPAGPPCALIVPEPPTVGATSRIAPPLPPPPAKVALLPPLPPSARIVSFTVIEAELTMRMAPPPAPPLPPLLVPDNTPPPPPEPPISGTRNGLP